MLIANAELNLPGGIREPGQPVPEALDWPEHVLRAHLKQRKVIEADQETASAISRKYRSARDEGLKLVEAKRVYRQRLTVEAAERALKETGSARVFAERDLENQRRILEIYEAGGETEEEKKAETPVPDMVASELVKLQRDLPSKEGPALETMAKTYGVKILPGMSKMKIAKAIVESHQGRNGHSASAADSKAAKSESSDLEKALKKMKPGPLSKLAKSLGLENGGGKAKLIKRLAEYPHGWTEKDGTWTPNAAPAPGAES